jgi:hypothetical protein
VNRFFVPDEVYKDRIAICKSCDKYLSLLGNCKICGCFMKVKARLAPMECAANPKKWQKTTKIETPKELPKEIIDEILDMWKDIKTGRAKDHTAKKRMIETYNVIHGTNYSAGTSCRSCLSTCFHGIKKLYNKYSE